jgi:hypothetical protein
MALLWRGLGILVLVGLGIGALVWSLHGSHDAPGPPKGVTYSTPPPFGGSPDITIPLPDKTVMTVSGGNASACHVGCIVWGEAATKEVQKQLGDAGTVGELAAGREAVVLKAKRCLELCSDAPRVAWPQ